ncbi:hypothetical protein FHT86_000810 [Rhizobium sp. BK313]|nr:hypothetical protein [Rhizobium sp. BK313]
MKCPKVYPHFQFNIDGLDAQEVELPDFREVDDVLRNILCAVSSRPSRDPF